jgi:hypothetical protein
MANSLDIFRGSIIERALRTEQDKDRIVKAERASRIETRIVEFEATIRAALQCQLVRPVAGISRFRVWCLRTISE